MEPLKAKIISFLKKMILGKNQYVQKVRHTIVATPYISIA